MPETRSEIREAVKAALDAAMTGHTVFDNRKYAFNRETMPMIDMMVSEVEAERQSMSNTRRETLTLMVRVSREGDAEAIDDILDNDGTNIDDALVFDETIKGLSQDFQLTGVSYNDSGEGAKPIVHMIMTYTVIVCVALIAPNLPDQVYFSNGFSSGFATQPEA